MPVHGNRNCRRISTLPEDTDFLFPTGCQWTPQDANRVVDDLASADTSSDLTVLRRLGVSRNVGVASSHKMPGAVGSQSCSLWMSHAPVLTASHKMPVGHFLALAMPVRDWGTGRARLRLRLPVPLIGSVPSLLPFLSLVVAPADDAGAGFHKMSLARLVLVAVTFMDVRSP
jgi:hypothetical protein